MDRLEEAVTNQSSGLARLEALLGGGGGGGGGERRSPSGGMSDQKDVWHVGRGREGRGDGGQWDDEEGGQVVRSLNITVPRMEIDGLHEMQQEVRCVELLVGLRVEG